MNGRVVVNGRALQRRITGVERYVHEVTQRLPTSAYVLGCDRLRVGWRGHAWEQVRLPKLLGAQDVLWSPANTGPVSVGRQVLTVHDVAPLDHPEWFRRRFAAWYRWLLPRLLRRVLYVITDSAFSQERILAHSGIRREQVRVVFPGVDGARFRRVSPEAVQAARRAYRLPERYLLVVGSLDPRKGLEGLVHAWKRVSSAFPDTGLALAGGEASTLRRTLPICDGEDVHLLGYVTDAHLPALYAGAVAFVLPSHYEGFGLPVLEAMACGTPVVATRAGALPEVAGDAALLVSLGDSTALEEALEAVLSDNSLADRLRTAGFRRAISFDWKNTADGVWAVLQLAAEA